MRPRFYFVIAATILFSVCPSRSWGQDEKPPILWGGFDTQGTVSAGYRFTTIKGDLSQYNDLFDLHKGFRLMDVNLTGRAPVGSNPFADSYSLTASGLGGDPYEAGQLTVRKDKLYDLTVNYRQSYYYWSQNNIDSQVVSMPTPSNFVRGLTPNHGWATIRRLGSVDLKVRATNHLQFSFDYDRNSRDGMTQATRTMYFNANDASLPSSISPGYSNFTHGDPFLVAAPIAELTDRITGGISYSLRRWTFHYRVGYQSFTQNESWNSLLTPGDACPTVTPANPNPSSVECSINLGNTAVVVAPSATALYNVNSVAQNEFLNPSSWAESRRVTTPVSEFSVNGKVNDWLELRGAYNYYDFKGPDGTVASFQGQMRGNTAVPPATTYAPFYVQVQNHASVTEPSHAGSAGLTAKITEYLNFFADYRYTRDTSEGLNNYSSIFTSYAPTTTTLTAYPAATNCCGTQDNKWTTGVHFVDLNMEYTPISSLVVRAGIRYVKRDVIEDTNGVQNVFTDVYLKTPYTTVQTKSVWPTVSVYYKPVKIFSVRGDFQSNTSSDPYTPISAHTDVGSRFVFRLQPIEKISIEDNFQIRDRLYSANSYRNQYRANAINLSYDFSNRITADVGYSYESIFGADAVNISPTSTTTPFVGFQQDAFINRAVRGGLLIKPAKGFGINFSGNYLRMTGASRLFSTAIPAVGIAPIAGVTPGLTGPIVWLPSDGPLTWPTATATVYYDFPRAGRLSIDFQRTYYVEQLISGNNFQADLLTIKWTTNVRRAGQ